MNNFLKSLHTGLSKSEKADVMALHARKLANASSFAARAAEARRQREQARA